MYGHVHRENFGIQRSFDTREPVGVNIWTGSVTTFSNADPSFRVIEVDAETMLPVKAHTYIFNVNDPNPKWAYSHELTAKYGMSDLSPSSFDALSARFKDDESLAIEYIGMKNQQGPIASCDAVCR